MKLHPRFIVELDRVKCSIRTAESWDFLTMPENPYADKIQIQTDVLLNSNLERMWRICYDDFVVKLAFNSMQASMRLAEFKARLVSPSRSVVPLAAFEQFINPDDSCVFPVKKPSSRSLYWARCEFTFKFMCSLNIREEGSLDAWYRCWDSLHSTSQRLAG